PKNQKKQKAPPGLYLRVSSAKGEDYRRACLVTNVFDGTVPVYIRFQDTGKLLRVPQNMFVEPNEVMLEELRRILGKDNVVYIE
ncbi:MAG TPA: hypothetical protein PLG48_03350, partial [Candidatus Avimonas sp.]|nr:hypothetical protein [Candidatus Avimonas sp.]